MDATNLTLVENINVFDQDSAMRYAALATNASNEVGIVYFLGGGTRFATLMAGILTGTRRDMEVASGQGGPLADDDGKSPVGRLSRPSASVSEYATVCGKRLLMKGSGKRRWQQPRLHSAFCDSR
jgi:hypothetical protein